MSWNKKAQPPPPAGMFCPLIKDACVEHACKFFTRVSGKLPQSLEVVDKFDCAIKWLPWLTIENSQMQHQTGAAVESARNEAKTSADAHAEQLERVAAAVEGLTSVVVQIANDDVDRARSITANGRSFLPGR